MKKKAQAKYTACFEYLLLQLTKSMSDVIKYLKLQHLTKLEHVSEMYHYFLGSC